MRCLAALILALVLASAGEACAHASLITTSPVDGELLAAAPTQVVLNFDEPVQVLMLRLVDDTGATLELPPSPLAQDVTIRAALPATLRTGTYVFSYRVASADSHPVGGAISFSVGKATSKGIAEAPAAAQFDTLRIAVRALRNMALLLAVGGALFCLLAGRWPGDSALLVCAGLAAASFTLGGMALHGAALAGSGEVLAIASWHAALHSSFGLSGLATIVGALAIAGGAMLRPGVMRHGLLVCGVLASIVSLTMTGHAASALPALLVRPALAAHVLAAAFWSGSLVALYLLLRTNSGSAIAAVMRFSHYAPVAVALLIAAGVGFTALQLRSADDLLTTPYGKLILAKAALLAVMLALAAYNRFRLTPRLARTEPGAARMLRRSIVAELVLIVTIVGVTAILVQTLPRSAPIVKTLTNGSRLATMTVAHGHAGRNKIVVRFRDVAGRSFDPAEAILELSNLAAGVEAMSRKLTRGANGEHVYEGGDVAFAGSWQLDLRARIGDFEQVAWATTIDIQ